MKLILPIFLLCLVSSSLATFFSVKKIPANIIDTSFLKSSAATSRKPSFTQLKSLMSQLRDVSQVTDFLNNLLTKGAEARQEKLAIIQQTRAHCTEEESFRQEAISEGEAAAKASQTQLDLCTNQKNLASNLNEQAATALPIHENHLQELNDQRAASKRDHEQRLAKLDAFEQDLVNLNHLLDNYEANGNNPSTDTQFIQSTNKLLKSGVRTGHSGMILPIYHKLIQMHTKQAVNEDVLTEIRSLIEQIQEASAETRKDLEQDEVNEQAAYETQRDSVQAIIDSLSAQIATTTAFVGKMDVCIAQEDSILELSNDKVQRNTDLLTATEQLCQAAEEEWRLSEVSRAREVNIINALLSAVKRIEQDYEVEQGPQVDTMGNIKLLL